MAFTLVGLVLLAFANSYLLILLSVAVVGIGSAVFHPEASRVARAASGGRHGFAQSLFQVGGNFGQSLGPLLAAFIVVPFGQHSVLIFTALALAAVVILTGVSRWYAAVRARPRKAAVATGPAHPSRVVRRTLFVLIVMLFSKVLYLSSLNSYYTFYLIQTFGVSIQTSQVLLFVFLASVAAGTFLGGPLVDRFGAKFVIWGSILGVLPFTLLLPHLGLLGTVINSIAIGLIISSAFSAMIVYAQELTPGNVGAVAGTVLRPELRPRRRRRGAARHAGGQDEPHLRLSGLRLPSGGRPVGRLPALRARQGGRHEDGLRRDAFAPPPFRKA